MLRKNNFTLLILIVTLMFRIQTFAQEKQMQMKDSTKTQMKMHKMNGMKENKMAVSNSDSSIARKGIIDLASIDMNKDGKVFQCPMEVNVISDAKGECPLCGMNLREISVLDAKAKLLKRGFKVMESSMEQNQKSDEHKNQASLNSWNKICPVTGEDVDPETSTVDFKGKIIGFCCSGCIAKFKKDPEKYLKNLSSDGAKFVGTN